MTKLEPSEMASINICWTPPLDTNGDNWEDRYVERGKHFLFQRNHTVFVF